jgi:UDP-N-acetylmuramoyl-tripeptide--D-alanyl-D-alanine ligase
MKFENLCTFGNEAKNVFIGARGLKNNFYFETKEDLTNYLLNILIKGDVIYFKGSRGMKLEEVVGKISSGF